MISIEIARETVPSNALWTDESFDINIAIRVLKPSLKIGIGLKIFNSLGQCIVHSSSLVNSSSLVREGTWIFRGRVPACVISAGDYFVTVSADEPNKEIFFVAENVLRFSITTKATTSSMYSVKSWTGALCPEVVAWDVSSA